VVLDGLGDCGCCGAGGASRGLGMGEAGIDGFPGCAGTSFSVMLLRVWCARLSDQSV
jgi:hypothetical protein